MTEQLSLEGFPVHTPITDRLFFALFPDDSSRLRIIQVAQQLSLQYHLKGNLLLPERFHITLLHLGDFSGLPDGLVRTAREAAATAVTPSFNVVFDRAQSFAKKAGNLPFVLSGGEALNQLQAFHRCLDLALRRRGVVCRDAARFTPHVTLLYDPTNISAVSIEPICWIVNEFLLIHSLLGETRYNVLGRWPLQCP